MASQTHQYFFFLISLLTLQSCQLFSSKAETGPKLYIVYMGEKKHENPDHVTASHHHMLASLLGSKEDALASIVYSYRHGFSGFAAMLTEVQAEQLAESDDVISIRPSRDYEIQTTRSWDFLGLNYTYPNNLLQKSNSGDGIIIGMVDTGIWPESRSFNDDGYGPIPSRWKGTCQVGEAFDANNCSRKIIGARYYTAGVDHSNLKIDYLSPRDYNGHGTFTASVAAGSVVPGVSFHGLAAGVARGGAPRARIAVYKAVWGTGGGSGAGNTATLLAAIDDAIHDGVSILSLSLAVLQEDSFGALHAVAKGITVVYAAGNQGPIPQSLLNTAPWVISVAASTIDRSFPTVITLGNNKSFVGQSIFYNSTYKSGNKFKPLVFGSDCSQESLNGTDISGSIVLCFPYSFSPPSDFVIAYENVLNAGGKGLIFAQFTTNVLTSQECIHIVCVLVDYGIGQQIIKYIATASSPQATVELTRNAVGQGVLSPKVAWFSSRGPALPFPGVLKPDVAAPGVAILGAYRDRYILASGTSLACPHVSGVVALLKVLHPDWSHAALKSALVTTASTTNDYGMPIQAEGIPRKIADPFDFGGGQIDPNKAADPGLVYDIDPMEYYKFFNCTSGQFKICAEVLGPVYYLNLPAISIPDLKTTTTVWRTVTNVGNVDAVYKVVIESPPGVQMVVEPSILVFNITAKMHSFKVTFMATHKLQGDYMFGSLTWFDGSAHVVRMPIAVRIVIQDFYADVA